MTARPITIDFVPFDVSRVDTIRIAREDALDALDRSKFKKRKKFLAMDNAQMMLFSRETRRGSAGARSRSKNSE